MSNVVSGGGGPLHLSRMGMSHRCEIECYFELLDGASAFAVDDPNRRRTNEDKRRQNIKMPPAIAPNTESKGMTASGPTYSISAREP
jgi:hypothetical protein